MRQIRKFTQKPIFSILMSCLILFISCNYDDTNLKEKQNKQLTGREYFKSIFFARGKVAEELPSIKNSYSYFIMNESYEANNSYEIDKQIDVLLDKIEIKNKKYFSNFKNNILSKNHLIIQESLKKGSELLFQISLETYFNKNTINEIKNKIQNIDFDQYKNDKGELNQEKLYQNFVADMDLNNTLDQGGSGGCVFAGIVLVAAAYVVVAHAAGVMTYVAGAWAVYVYAAVSQSVTITRGGKINQNEENNYNLSEENLINDIISL